VYMNPKTGQTMTIGLALEKNYIMGQLIHKTDQTELFRSTIVASRKDEIISAYSPITGTYISPAQAVALGLLSKVSGRFNRSVVIMCNNVYVCL